VFRWVGTVLWTLAVAALAQAAPPDAPASSPTATKTAARHQGWLDTDRAFGSRLGAAAEERATHHVVYDGTGYPIAYPMGDVPTDNGTCTDEVVRAYRLLGIDLQQLVHEDMLRAFAAYPTKYNLSAPDPNVDHRRVYNLQAFFNRNAEVLPISDSGKDYKPGDIIIWDLDNFQLHIGIVTRRWSHGHKRPLVMHNISSGPHVEDKLFEYKIIGHYRFEGALKADATPAPVEAPATPAETTVPTP